MFELDGERDNKLRSYALGCLASDRILRYRRWNCIYGLIVSCAFYTTLAGIVLKSIAFILFAVRADRTQ